MQDAREVMIRGQVAAETYLARRRRQAKAARIAEYAKGIAVATAQGGALIFHALMGRSIQRG